MNKKKIIKKKGGCGCQKSNNDLILKGGASFDVNNNYVNPLNNYNSDQNDPSVVMSVRTQPNMNSSFLSGGKKKNTKSKKSKRSKSNTVKKTKRRTIRKKKGGADPVLSSQNANIISSFNTVLGAQTSANIITTTNDPIMNSSSKINPNIPFI
jgi:hypothetical protein